MTQVLQTKQNAIDSAFQYLGDLLTRREDSDSSDDTPFTEFHFNQLQVVFRTLRREATPIVVEQVTTFYPPPSEETGCSQLEYLKKNLASRFDFELFARWLEESLTHTITGNDIPALAEQCTRDCSSEDVMRQSLYRLQRMGLLARAGVNIYILSDLGEYVYGELKKSTVE